MKTLNQMAAFAVLVSFTGFAFAASNVGEVQKRIVHYADLDLSHKAGANALLKRIRYAAHDVCTPQMNQAYSASVEYHQCVVAAIERAVTEVNAPVVAAMYREALVR